MDNLTYLEKIAELLSGLAAAGAEGNVPALLASTRKRLAVTRRKLAATESMRVRDLDYMDAAGIRPSGPLYPGLE